MERWTFLIIADEGGAPTQLRVVLRAGMDESAWPAAQLGVDGVAVDLDATAHDYEAPEWKAVQILEAGMDGGAEMRLGQVKDELRSRSRAA